MDVGTAGFFSGTLFVESFMLVVFVAGARQKHQFRLCGELAVW